MRPPRESPILCLEHDPFDTGVRLAMSNGPFHVMIKPSGPLCNLDCHYCYYLEKERLFPPGPTFRMAPEVLETSVRDYIASQPTREVQFTWQGGEPTLLGLDFFRAVVDLQRRHAGGKRISNTIQTNGTLLDAEWCSFFSEHGFLVGLSIDGPEGLHDAYRVDKGGHPTFKKVIRGLELLKKHQTEFNTLTVVNRLNAEAPSEVYRFLKEIGSGFLQFIPLVEREPDSGARALQLDLAVPPKQEESETPPVTPWSVGPSQYGDFLLEVFDEWVRRDVGNVFVQIFDVTLAGWAGMEPPLCVFAKTCGNAMVLEHNGDLYSCDHYVYPDYRLGNIQETPIGELAVKPEQLAFGQAKKDALPAFCRRCDVRYLCNGECPKHRFVETPDGEPGLNYLCPSYKSFFTRTAPHFQIMADLLRQRRAPAEIMSILPEMERKAALSEAGRNDPCPCGSGKKVKHCCGAT